MKTIYYIIILLVGGIILNGCETDENGPMPDSFEEAAVAYMVLDQTSSGLVNLNDLGAFNFVGTIDVLYDPSFDKLTLMVAYNGDYANPGVLIDNITSIPYDFSVSINDVVNAVSQLNSTDDIEISDYFTFYVNVIKNGKEYPVYVMVGGKAIRTIGSGLITSVQEFEDANALTDVRIDVPCGYSVEEVTGNYNAVSGPWGVNGPITITADPEDPFVVYVAGLETIDGLEEDKGPLKMIIDPNSYNVVAEKTVLASLVTWGAPYHNIAYEGSGRLNTCDGTYEMTFSITVDEGSFGSFPFTLTKQ
jgi:hypothetical protein